MRFFLGNQNSCTIFRFSLTLVLSLWQKLFLNLYYLNWFQLEKFLDFITIQEQLDKLPQRWIELRVLMVTEEWRGRGVARRLVERSIQEAKAAGFRALAMCCVNEYTARLARSLGWKEHYRLAYRDYPRLSGRNVQLIPNPPHEHVYCYYTELTDD